MKYLYLDNFRGFRDALIPIADVNFLVGENSTGKSSLLNLIDILTSRSFVGYCRFRSSGSEFGHFDEVVSAHANDRSYFRIGFIDSNQFGRSDKHSRTTAALLITYKDEDGLPEPASISVGSFGMSAHARAQPSRNLGKFEPFDVRNFDDFIGTTWRQWLELHKASRVKGFEVLEFDSIGVIPSSFMLAYRFQRSAKNRGPKAEDQESSIDESAVYKAIMEDLPSQAILGSESQFVSIAPIRTHPQRTYDRHLTDFSPSGEHTPYLIQRILKSETDAKQFTNSLAEIGKNSGLFQSIKVKKLGRGKSSPFELDIVLDKKAFSINTVGYGVSQALPVIVEALYRPGESLFSVQQPEVHLHPKAQAALGDLVFSLATTENKKFLIETHSDYLVDRYRLACANSKTKARPTSQILFFERKRGRNRVSPLAISSQGKLPSNQPTGYRDFFIKEDLRLLDV